MKRKATVNTIDWPAVHRRMKATSEVLEREFEPDPAALTAILQRRAEAIARAPTLEDSGELLEVVEFVLAHERYALESAYIREVCPLKTLTPLPCVPSFLFGVVNVHGQIVSVIDLKRFFGLPLTGLPDLNKVIILHDGAMAFGVLADQILGATTVPLASLQDALPTLTGIRAEYLKGIAPGRLIVLDGAALLRDPDLVVNEEVL
ncbi:chemotaxis protein CheW [Andreprevotia chitinilytica]|uniref:chemotaxis protein CheW n=1 Tax=Andreprevotia chitinilytica TaxID=396808 RepID=UPI00054D17CE|nr:chemotaxis protein CheW [Andreprevotia chitinilytica]